ncbi:MAG: SDR family oxidoreductase [Candidatus Competibacteraceae bacterium]|nr:SDR family oxidoreductase [Candidatus Competibacteraceae bacterium]
MTPDQTTPDAPFRFTSFDDGLQILIQGASRGIGLEFVRQLLDCSQVARVFAACRDPAGSAGLQNLQDDYGARLVPVALDLNREETIEAAAARVAELTDRLQLLINTAGLLHDGQGLWPEKRLSQVRLDNLYKSFQVNAFGPLLVAKHFDKLLGHRQRAIFASLSARVGSIQDNRLGGWYAYRAAKAAQNMFTRTLSLEFARKRTGTLCVALHPGTTDTGLSKPFQDNVPEGQLFSRAYSVRCLLQVIDGLAPEDNGGFFAFDGERIEW